MSMDSSDSLVVPCCQTDKNFREQAFVDAWVDNVRVQQHTCGVCSNDSMSEVFKEQDQ